MQNFEIFVRGELDAQDKLNRNFDIAKAGIEEAAQSGGGGVDPSVIAAAIEYHDNDPTAHTAQFAAKVDKSGGTMTGPLIAGGTQTEATAQTRNSVILPVGTTDFSAVPNNTLIFVKEA